MALIDIGPLMFGSQENIIQWFQQKSLISATKQCHRLESFIEGVDDDDVVLVSEFPMQSAMQPNNARLPKVLQSRFTNGSVKSVLGNCCKATLYLEELVR